VLNGEKISRHIACQDKQVEASIACFHLFIFQGILHYSNKQFKTAKHDEFFKEREWFYLQFYSVFILLLCVSYIF